VPDGSPQSFQARQLNVPILGFQHRPSPGNAKTLVLVVGKRLGHQAVGLTAGFEASLAEKIPKPRVEWMQGHLTLLSFMQAAFLNSLRSLASVMS